jgi:Phosphate-selective porin O and P
MERGFRKTLRKLLQAALVAFAVCPAAAAAEGWNAEDNAADASSAVTALPRIVAPPVGGNSSDQGASLRHVTMDYSSGDPAPPSNPFSSCPTLGCEPGGGGTMSWAPDRWCNVDAAIRTSFNSLGDDLPDHNYFAVDNAFLFFTGKITRVIGFQISTDIAGANGDSPTGFSAGLPDSIHLLDAIASLEFNDYMNFWMGRMLPPSDRADLAGPLYINGWDYPFVSNYPGVFEGREDGVAYWGQYGGGQLKWQFGVYNGQGRFGAGNDWPSSSTGPNTNGDPEFAMRVVVNLLDPEPGYYDASTYYGQKNIAAIGFAMMDQADALTDANNRVGTFFGWNVDFLFENKMSSWGSFTLEGAYYDYSVGGDVANGVAGKAGFVFGGWMCPRTIGCGGFCGYLRPYLRYQNYDHADEAYAEANSLPREEWDGGLQFIFCDGHGVASRSRLDFFYGERRDECGCRERILSTGIQLFF